MASAFNCDVRVATEGTTAVEIAEDWHPEIVLLDLMMPGMDGFRVAERLPVGTKIVAVTTLAGRAGCPLRPLLGQAGAQGDRWPGDSTVVFVQLTVSASRRDASRCNL
jgi:CheY-like chemotaxis protein